MAFDEEDLTREVIEEILGMVEDELKKRGLSSLIAFRGDRREVVDLESRTSGGLTFFMPHF